MTTASLQNKIVARDWEISILLLCVYTFFKLLIEVMTLMFIRATNSTGTEYVEYLAISGQRLREK
jgi:hypothetical protein